MAIDTSNSAVRRRNVSPKSSTLHVQTRDVDCSALDYAPEDGEFILLSGDAADPTLVYSGVNAAAVTAAASGALLRMVWSSARRSDRAALGDKRVPVIASSAGMDVDVALYNSDGGAPAMEDTYPAGTLLTVAVAAETLTNVPNDVKDKRFILTPMAADQTGWCVGFVREEASGSAGDDNAIKIHLYGTPQWRGATA